MPSPNVAEDHQTKNALSLSDKAAAVLVKDVDAEATLASTAIEVLTDTSKLSTLTNNISSMEKHQAADEIVNEIFQSTY